MPELVDLSSLLERVGSGSILYEPVDPSGRIFVPMAIVAEATDISRHPRFGTRCVIQPNWCLTRIGAWLATRPISLPLGFTAEQDVDINPAPLDWLVERFGLTVAWAPGAERRREFPLFTAGFEFKWDALRPEATIPFAFRGLGPCRACPHEDHVGDCTVCGCKG